MELWLSGFNENEQLRIGIDGITLLLKSTDSVDWDEFVSPPIITQGVHSLDIAILSNFEVAVSTFTSKARVIIKNISFANTKFGGATQCFECPGGQYSTGATSRCSQCPVGHAPNAGHTACDLCPEGTISPFEGSDCIECQDYTYADETRTSCLPYDVIETKADQRFHLHQLLAVDLFCEDSENIHQCDGESKAVGPIKDQEASSKQVFYFTNQQPLATERYEFHKNKNSSIADSSFIYMLQEMKDLSLT